MATTVKYSDVKLFWRRIVSKEETGYKFVERSQFDGSIVSKKKIQFLATAPKFISR
jgi:hypothetical protein